VCHNGDILSYLLSYFLLFPRGIVIGYNVIAMYKNMVTLFLSSTLAFTINYVIATVVARHIDSPRPGWPLAPMQTCDFSPAVPDPSMVSSISFVLQIAIMKHTCGVGVSRGLIINMLLMAVLYVTATVVNQYMYLWQAMASVSVAIALSVAWAMMADLVMHGRFEEISCTRTFRVMGLVDDSNPLPISGSSAQASASSSIAPRTSIGNAPLCTYHSMVDKCARDHILRFHPSQSLSSDVMMMMGDRDMEDDDDTLYKTRRRMRPLQNV
jgi:hypothetical protein